MGGGHLPRQPCPQDAQMLGAAALVAAMQIPRCKHYPSDVGAGAVPGVATAALVNAFGDARN